MDDIDIDAMVALYNRKWTYEQIGEKYGCSGSYIGTLFKQHGKQGRSYTQRIKRTVSRIDGNKSLRQIALEFVRDTRAKRGNAPTLKEIAAYLYHGDTRNSGNVLTTVIEPLIAEGFLVRDGKRKARTLQLSVPQPRENYDDERGE